MYSSSVPSSLGLDVTFDSYQYDGNGADGIVFFLAASDPDERQRVTHHLGSVRWPPRVLDLTAHQHAGLTHGYLGFGLDVFGNYSNKDLDGPACNETHGVRSGVGHCARSR